MSAAERRWAPLVFLVGLLFGCEEPGPPPELREEIAAMRAILREDPAAAAIEEAEGIAFERPVHAAEALERDAIPAAHRQLARARELAAETAEGRAYAQRLADAYAGRISGLERWRLYLADGAIDDVALLEATRMLREAAVALVELDRELDDPFPSERPRPD